MKRTFLKAVPTLLLVCCLILSVMPQVAAAETLQVGYIDAAVPVSDINGDTVEIRIVSENGASTVYTLANRVQINDELVKTNFLNDVDFNTLSAQLVDRFVQYKVDSNGEIRKINYQTSYIRLTDQTYNPETRSFSGVYGDRAVFYQKGMYNPVLSTKHIYVIEDYSYALNITEIRAKDGKDTVLSIESSTGISSNFTGIISLDLLTDITAGRIGVTLHAPNGSTVAQTYETIDSDGFAFVHFNNLPNQTVQYTADLWIENTQNTQTSHTYHIRLQYNAHPVSSVYVDRIAVDSDISGSKLKFCVLDVNGNTWEYQSAKRFCVNGTYFYLDTERELQAVAEALCGKLVKMAWRGRDVAVIYYEDTPLRSLDDLSYNTQTGQLTGLASGLPVFYKNGIAAPYLDDKHTYDVEVYSYAINIVNMQANNDMVTVEPTKLQTAIDGDFSLLVYGEYSCSIDEGTMVYQCKDATGQIIASWQEDFYDYVSYLEIPNLPNENGTYSISLWAEDENGSRISPVYTYTYCVSSTPVHEGYIYAVAPVSTINGDGLEVGIRFANGTEKAFPFSSVFSMDGVGIRIRYENLLDLINQIERLTYVRFALNESGHICVLRSDRLQAQNNACAVSDVVVYKDAVEATVQFSENYTKETMFVLVALYDESGRMTGWTFEEVEVPSDKNQAVQVQMETDASAPYTSGKIFMWESLLIPSR